MRLRSALAVGVLGWTTVAACGWDPSRPFEREAPPVNDAIRALDAGDATAAAATLQAYLSTGKCESGSIGAPELVRKRPNGTFDLGLSLFKIGEAYGRRFGEEEADGGLDEARAALRDGEIDCALRLVRVVAEDAANGIDLRARARYLEGNLLFLGRRYQDAVKAFDAALVLAPGMVDAGDPVGRDAAWNRSIALRRIEDDKKKDAGRDSSPDGAGDGSSDAQGEGGGRGDSGGGEGGGGGPDAGPDGADASPPPEADGGAPPPPQSNQDEIMLDQLERTPTLQQHVAKEQRKARPRVVPGMMDK